MDTTDTVPENVLKIPPPPPPPRKGVHQITVVSLPRRVNFPVKSLRDSC